ncbi:MAG: hypothetical protein HY904_19730 [Deltaproteobacteria bacterium]|nr:hypothetical protein [Deltaproteobacteria bacterium]
MTKLDRSASGARHGWWGREILIDSLYPELAKGNRQLAGEADDDGVAEPEPQPGTPG